MSVWKKLWHESQWLDRIAIAGGAASIAFFGGFLLRQQNQNPPLPPLFQDTPATKGLAATHSLKTPAVIKVHVTGGVVKPGLFAVARNARVQDAIRTAGGASKDGRPDTLNLAAHMEDGEQIRVPTGSEVAASLTTHQNDSEHEHEITHDGSKTTVATARVSKHILPLKLVNVNSASAAELDKLPGIGPALATRIIIYRTQYGHFKSLDDLDQVSGIGTKKLEKLRPYVAF